MPNFAQEFPSLIFLPLLVFSAVAVVSGMIHLAILVEAKRGARRAVLRQAARSIVPAETPALAAAPEPQRARQPKTLQTSLALELEYRRLSEQMPLSERLDAFARELAALSKQAGHDMTKADTDQMFGTS